MADRPGGSPAVAEGRRLVAGDVVRVKHIDVAGHVRTPGYVQGARGTVERDLGEHPNPEVLAYLQTAPAVRLFRVRFEGSALFPGRSGSGASTVTVDIYEHWLERVG